MCNIWYKIVQRWEKFDTQSLMHYEGRTLLWILLTCSYCCYCYYFSLLLRIKVKALSYTSPVKLEFMYHKVPPIRRLCATRDGLPSTDCACECHHWWPGISTCSLGRVLVIVTKLNWLAHIPCLPLGLKTCKTVMQCSPLRSLFPGVWMFNAGVYMCASGRRWPCSHHTHAMFPETGGSSEWKQITFCLTIISAP